MFSAKCGSSSTPCYFLASGVQVPLHCPSPRMPQLEAQPSLTQTTRPGLSRTPSSPCPWCPASCGIRSRVRQHLALPTPSQTKAGPCLKAWPPVEASFPIPGPGAGDPDFTIDATLWLIPTSSNWYPFCDLCFIWYPSYTWYPFFVSTLLLLIPSI
jgi:hypothetical protein